MDGRLIEVGICLLIELICAFSNYLVSYFINIVSLVEREKFREVDELVDEVNKGKEGVYAVFVRYIVFFSLLVFVEDKQHVTVFLDGVEDVVVYVVVEIGVLHVDGRVRFVLSLFIGNASYYLTTK